MKDINRRHFICLAGSFILGSLAGCGNPTSHENKGKRTTRSSNSHGRYETLEDRADNNGEINITSEITGESFNIRTVGSDGLRFSAEISFYNDDKGNLMIMSKDPSLNYFPGLQVNKGNLITRTLGLDGSFDILMYVVNNYNKFEDIYAYLLEGMPTFDQNNLLSIPGIQYKGDWSFNEIKRFSTFLNDSITILVPIFPGIAPVAAVTKISDEIADNVDDLIDFLNERTSLNINKDRKYEFYSISGINFFLPAASDTVNYSKDVRNYTRFGQGSWWTYTDGRNIVGIEINGFRRINGIDVPITRDTQGNEGYQGFVDNVFLKSFGGKINQGRDDFEFIYSPPIIIGDDRLGVNRIFFSSNIRVNGEGSYSSSYNWRRIETVTVPYGRLDDCWKAEEISEDQSVTRYFGRNIGLVKLNAGGSELKLYDFGSGGLPSGISFSKVDPFLSIALIGNPLRQHL